jgi:hypothetical protein
MLGQVRNPQSKDLKRSWSLFAFKGNGPDKGFGAAQFF